MFNENSDSWLSIYKGLTIFFFFAFIIGGFVFGIIDMGEGIVFDAEGFCIPIWLIIGVVVAFVQLVTNMLIIQLLKNVKAIKDKLAPESSKSDSELILSNLQVIRDKISAKTGNNPTIPDELPDL